MATDIETVDRLQEYLTEVMSRAEHHADAVNGVALALVGAMIWKKDKDRAVEVWGQGGQGVNVLWAYIGGNRYAFSYNHDAREIEMREGGVRGKVKHTFKDQMSPDDVVEIFESL